jgi:hypothetical protein
MRLFVSYRREDSEGYVGALELALENTEDRQSVEAFVDARKIAIGVDFVRAMLLAVKSCDAVLVMIGPRWRGIAKSGKEPRIYATDDPVRLELATALASGVPVFAALLNGANLPRANEVPSDLARLVTVPAVELRDADFDGDVARMTAHIRSCVNPPDRAAPAPVILEVQAPPGVYWSSLELIVDGKSAGRFKPKTNSPAEFRLEPGTHTIQAKDDWWKSNPLTFMAAAGERVGVLYTPGPLAWHMKLSLLQ